MSSAVSAALCKTFRRRRTPFRCSPTKCSASLPEQRSPCGRNRVHLPTGIPFGFPPEPRSDVTGFITTSAAVWSTDSLLIVAFCLLAWMVWRKSKSDLDLRNRTDGQSSEVNYISRPHIPVVLQVPDNSFSDEVVHIAKAGEYLGAFQPQEVLRQVSTGGLSGRDLYWRVGMPAWQNLDVAMELFS